MTTLEKFFKKYKSNQDKNLHSENIVLVAKTFGSKEDIQEAKDILESHNKIGYLTDSLLSRRMVLHNKLYPKVLTTN